MFDVGTGTWDLTTKQSLYTYCWTTIPSTIKETPMGFFGFFLISTGFDTEGENHSLL